MKRLSKAESRQRWSELRALWNAWDPIGVSGLEGPLDEYDTYVGQTLRLLEASATEAEIVERLSFIVGEYIGLGPTGVAHANPSAFAQQMRAWFAADWGGTVA